MNEIKSFGYKNGKKHPSVFLYYYNNAKEEGYVKREIMLKDLIPGMVLAGDVKTEKGMLLIQKGQEITNTLRTRLLNINNVNSIVEPIRIIKEIQKTVD